MNSLFFFNELLYATAWVSSLHGNLGEWVIQEKERWP
jgi:hypothetical protein